MKSVRSKWEFFLENPKFTTIFTIAVIALGFFSIVQMPKESTPEVDIPVAIIATPFPGAGAEDVELLVTDPIEERISSIDGIDSLTSESSRGLSVISIQFNANVDGKEKINDVKDAVDQAAVDLPNDVEDSNVSKVSFTDLPILTMALSGPYDREVLTQYAEVIKDEIEQVNGVSNVRIIGGRNREIRVRLDQRSLQGFGLSLSDVTRAISFANTDIPLGSIETAGALYTLRFEGKIEDVEQVKRIPIARREQAIIRLDDVADVYDSYEDIGSVARLSVDGQESNDAVTIRVFKVSGADIVRTADKSQEIARETVAELPDGVIIETVEDSAEFIRRDLGSLLRNGISTVIIVFIILLFFLGTREALLAGLAIPLTFLITFAILSPLGYTLNSLTLFSLILSLGILVDSAIVMTEAIHHQIQKGNTPKEAAKKAIHEFELPLIAGTLTTVFAFVPMLLTSGIIGQFIRSIPITVTIVLFASLLVALGIITTFAKRFFKRSNDAKQHRFQEKIQTVMSSVRTSYMNSLRSYLEQKKKRVALFAVLFFLFIGSVALPAVGILQVNMFPASDEDTFWINVELPIGSPLSTTDVVLQQVEAELLDDERILSFSANVGQSSNAGSVESGTQSDTHLGYIVVNLNPEREERSTDIVAQYEQELAGLINGVHIEVIQQSSGPEDSAPVEIRVIGEDLLILEDMATAIETQLKQVPGTKNVDTTIQQTNGELVVDIDRNQAQLYGVSPQDIAGLLRGALVGTDATTLRTAGDDVDVRVEYTLGQSFDERSLSPNQINISDIESLTILTQKGEVPLKNLASIRLAHNRARVSHLDGNRVIRINSQVETGTTAQQVFLAAQAFVDDMYIPDGYVIEMGGEREDINESFADMFRAFILAIFMIGALLVLQFKSYRQPLFILVTIPLSLIGVLPGLVLMNQPLSFPGIIGVVALAGIVVNNAIILIDRMNLNVREKGHDLNHAIEQAAGSRLQPILLTTITTVSGILPLAMSDPVWGPLGYSIVFGLLFSTVTTLFVVPMLYQRYSDFSKKQRMQKKKKMGFLQGVSK